jgi:hypothetical protein
MPVVIFTRSDNKRQAVKLKAIQALKTFTPITLFTSLKSTVQDSLFAMNTRGYYRLGNDCDALAYGSNSWHLA